MTILAIETSCDETSIALVEASGTIQKPQFRIIKNIVSSQIPIHRPFGGVVPNLAKREHIKNLPIVLGRILKLKSYGLRPTVDELKSLKTVAKRNSSTQAERNSLTIDMIAVTVGPGLEPALWTGIEFAKKLARELKIPLVGANHLEGHLYSFLGRTDTKRYPSGYTLVASGSFPAIALIVSGGHTILLKLDSLTKLKKLGETRDDAAGEAFDKVARMLNLPYPGGPEIARLAMKGNPRAIAFPRPMMNDKSYDFSFSGLKTAVLYYLRDQATNHLSLATRANVAANFQQAVVDVLVAKTMCAAREYGAKSVILCGGVAANQLLRKTFKLKTSNSQLNFFVPPMELNGDNAAMIAIAAYINLLRKNKLNGAKSRILRGYQLAAQGDLGI